MATMMWCLKHSRKAIMYQDPDVNFHMDWKAQDICTGPFFTSAPPDELENGWQDELDEPSVEELQEMDKMSELLLWDLGLVEI